MSKKTMTPFEEALIDAILEEYAEIPSHAQNAEHQSIQHEAVQIKKRGEYNANYSAAELERTSLWLDRGKKYIYLHPIPDARQYIFLNQVSKNMCLETLIRSGYTLQD